MFREIVFAMSLLASSGACAIDTSKESGAKLRVVVEEMAAALRERALPPKDEQRFDAALGKLRTLVAQDKVGVDEFRSSVKDLLAEIDSDGHTHLISILQAASNWAISRNCDPVPAG